MLEKPDTRLFFPATKRNKDCIGNVLANFLPNDGVVLEIASGSGEHGVTFQTRFQGITWQTSDPNPSFRRSISSWINHEGLENKMPQPIDLNVRNRPWPLNPKLQKNLKAIVCINLLHISVWSCTRALFEEASLCLQTKQFLFIYGPFKRNGKHTSKSNELFDQSLRKENPNWGVRDSEKVHEIAIKNSFKKLDVIAMPANNLLIVYHLDKNT